MIHTCHFTLLWSSSLLACFGFCYRKKNYGVLQYTQLNLVCQFDNHFPRRFLAIALISYIKSNCVSISYLHLLLPSLLLPFCVLMVSSETKSRSEEINKLNKLLVIFLKRDHNLICCITLKPQGRANCMRNFVLLCLQIKTQLKY